MFCLQSLALLRRHHNPLTGTGSGASLPFRHCAQNVCLLGKPGSLSVARQGAACYNKEKREAADRSPLQSLTFPILSFFVF